MNCLLVSSLLQIVLDNKAHSGKVKMRLENQAFIKECRNTSVSGQGETMSGWAVVLKRGEGSICILVLEGSQLLRLSERRLTALHSHIKPTAQNYTRVAFDVAVALVCLLSLLLCGRSILRGVTLQQVRIS